MGVRICVAVLAVAASSGCSMSAEHGGRFRCDDDHRCPEGQACEGGFCALMGSIDAEPTVVGYEEAVLEDEPIGYWRLDDLEGSAAVDRSGNGHDGTFAGDPELGAAGASSGTGTAVRFDGDNDFMSIGDAPELRLAGSFTIEAWIRADGSPVAEFPGLVTKGGPGGFTLYYYRWFEHLRPSLVREEGTERAVTETGTLDQDSFRHYAVTFDEEEELLTWYVDGVVDGTHPVSYADVDNLSPVEVGRQAGEYARISIDELALYDTALTAARVLAHVEAAAD